MYHLFYSISESVVLILSLDSVQEYIQGFFPHLFRFPIDK